MNPPKPKNNPYVVGRTVSTYPLNRQSAHVPTQLPTENPDKKNRLWKRVLLTIFLLFLITVLTVGTWDAYNLSRASSKIFGTSNLLGALAPTELNGAARERVNIMVVGYSADDPGHDGAKLTDSILIVSLSTAGRNSYMLSVPRDLYVKIPESGRAKINEAYQRGELNEFNEPDYPKGGIGLLEKTITNSFGIPIDYYALVNYAAVREITDATGGITVNIQSSDPRGIYDPNFQPQEGGPLTLANGLQTIDGQTALRLTRARGAAGGYGLAQSDFDRTKNQQLVFQAIKESVSWQDILNPLRNGRLLDAVGNNVRTDVKINEATPLFRLFNSVPSGQLNSVTLRDIDKVNYLTDYTTPLGQSALIPAAGLSDFSNIQRVIEKLDQ